MSLRNLIDEVERGDIDDGTLHATFDVVHWASVEDAFKGSLDAAKSLHDALLPGWIFDITNGSALVMPQSPWDVPDDARPDDKYPQWSGESDVDARAWLLAILRALEQEGR